MKAQPAPSFASACFFFAIVVNIPGLAMATEHTIPTELFDPGFLEGDCNYHSLTSASDGKLYFTIGTHHPKVSARLYSYSYEEGRITLLAKLGDLLAEDVEKQVTSGKVHTPLIEHAGSLYFATHTAYYRGNLPNIAPEDGRKPYAGGRFMRYDLETGVFEILAHLQLPNEGIITMALDPRSETLYGLTWPTGLLLSFNLKEGLLHNWGAVQQRGEWGRLPGEWNFICRRLGVDESGVVYGATDTGRIWRFEQGRQRPVDYLENLDLVAVAPVQESDFEMLPESHFFWNNWRTILWNPGTESFWGLQGGSSQLFEFKPDVGTLRSVRPFRPASVNAQTRRNPLRSQLGFTLGPNNTLLYLAHAPGIEVEGRPELGTSVHLLTYAIDQDRFTDHGRLVAPNGRRIFFAESLALGDDDHLYTVAWVETLEPKRAQAVREARASGTPDEQKDNEAVYEMMLVRLPPVQRFLP